jgi:hypothetical protein
MFGVAWVVMGVGKFTSFSDIEFFRTDTLNNIAQCHTVFGQYGDLQSEFAVL